MCNDAGGNALAWTLGMGNFTNSYGVDGATGKEDLGSAQFFQETGVLRKMAAISIYDPKRIPVSGFGNEALCQHIQHQHEPLEITLRRVLRE